MWVHCPGQRQGGQGTQAEPSRARPSLGQDRAWGPVAALEPPLGKDSCSVLLDLNPRGPEAPAAANIVQPLGGGLGGFPRGEGESGSGPGAAEPGARTPPSRTPCSLATLCSPIRSELHFLFFCIWKTRLFNSSRPEVQGGGCTMAWAQPAPLGPALTLRLRRSRAVPSLDHDRGVMGLIYCRKPLKAQELCSARDNRHKAGI